MNTTSGRAAKTQRREEALQREADAAVSPRTVAERAKARGFTHTPKSERNKR